MKTSANWLTNVAVLIVLFLSLPLAGQIQSAPADLSLLDAEIKAGLQRRDQEEVFGRYLKWTANRLDASAGENTWSDKTGNARLSWVDKMLRAPLWAVGESERFSRSLFTMASDSPQGLQDMFAFARVRLDLPAQHKEHIQQLKPETAEQAIALMVRVMEQSDQAMTQAILPLSIVQRRELQKLLYPITTGDVKFGYSFANMKQGREVCNLIEKVDRDALMAAGEAVLPLTSSEFITAIQGYKSSSTIQARQVPGVTGKILQRISTKAGDILIGSSDDNTYDLDRMPNVAAVIDLGGNDTYIEGQVGETKQVLIVIDLAGDDTYRGEKPGIQGGAILGVSLLIDAAGNNTYQARDIAQGACLVGTGILIDRGENSSYLGYRRSQGSAIAGVGLLLDHKGDDRYRAALLSQGVGGPWGLGLAIDLQGKDEFFAGGVFASSYDDSPGYEAWSQGVGVGPRGVANGGIGVLLSGPGDDVYECDYFSHGGGYWFAVGIARDFGGNDQRVGSTRSAYEGGERKVKHFLRWGIAFQAHYGAGFVIDDQGNDHYEGNSACLGFSWDIGVAALLDFQGDDVYINPRGQGAEASIGILFDADGDDQYRGGAQGYAREKVNYHRMPDAGGNFSFLIDYGGTNSFAKGIVDHSYNQRGAPSGFLISRPQTPTIKQISLDSVVSE